MSSEARTQPAARAHSRRATIRRSVGALLPKAQREYLRWHGERFGMWAALRAWPSLLSSDVASVPLPGGGRMWLRPGTADQQVFDDIFIQHEYAVGIRQAEYIVDAGAHIGCAALFFTNLFPAARIIAIEPDARNFQLLSRNVGHLTNVVAVHGALWSHATRVAIRNPHKKTYSYRVAESTVAGAVPSYSVLEVMEQFNLPHVDVLKMDIEGSEVEALQDAKRWMDRVRILIVETHDRWRDGCSAAVDAATAGENFIRRNASGGPVTIFERPGEFGVGGVRCASPVMRPDHKP